MVVRERRSELAAVPRAGRNVGWIREERRERAGKTVSSMPTHATDLLSSFGWSDLFIDYAVVK